MSKREDIERGRLVYSCNCGWIDLNHMEDPATRPFVGATNLWKQLDSTEPARVRGMCIEPSLNLLPPFTPTYRFYHAEAQARFPDGRAGFKVTYKQDMGNRHMTFGVERSYLVRFGLTTKQKKSVALAIFMEVSKGFEAYQGNWFWSWLTDSGFSQEDLVSDLLGFYIAIGELSKEQVLELCHPASKEDSLALWDAQGAVGSHKNTKFEPMLSENPPDECAKQPMAFPQELKKITPVAKGELFIDFPSLPDDACANAPARGWRLPVLGL